MKRILLVIPALVVLGVSASCRQADKAEEVPMRMGAHFILPDEERVRLERKALAGDVDAARRLLSHWEFGVRGPWQKALPWHKLAAEHGDGVDAWNYHQALPSKTAAAEKRRWLQISASRGEALAIDKLKSLETKESP